MHPSEDLALLAFYRGDAPDWNGRRLEEIWSWTDERLEAVHDYIQWMFPLSVRSGANPAAPILGPMSIEAFAASEALRERLDRSLRVMLRFYGLEEIRTEGALQIVRTEPLPRARPGVAVARQSQSPAADAHHDLAR